MKCAVCGYEKKTDDEPDWRRIRVMSQIKGSDFGDLTIEMEPATNWAAAVWACPKCGTLQI